MKDRIRSALLLGASLRCSCCHRGRRRQPARGQEAAEKAGKDVFGPTKVWQFHLEITAKDWDAMQPVGGMRLSGFSRRSQEGPGETCRQERRRA